MPDKRRNFAIQGFHHAAMRVTDLEASLKFYIEGLGFRASTAWGEGDRRAIMLDAGNGNYLELFAGGTGEPRPQGVLLHFALRTDDVDAAVEAARAAGAQVTMEPRDLDIPSQPVPPVRFAFCKGPDGEVIEFFHDKTATKDV